MDEARPVTFRGSIRVPGPRHVKFECHDSSLTFPVTTFTPKMQFFSVFACLALAIAALAAKEPPTELQIDTTFLPEDCSVKAKTGDKVQVHYVCDYCYYLTPGILMPSRRAPCLLRVTNSTPGKNESVTHLLPVLSELRLVSTADNPCH